MSPAAEKLRKQAFAIAFSVSCRKNKLAAVRAWADVMKRFLATP